MKLLRAATSGARIRVRAETSSESLEFVSTCRPFAVARIVDAVGDVAEMKLGQRVVVGCPNRGDVEFDAPPDASLPIDDDLTTANALLLPHTARALRIWRLLALEIGEAAVYTVGTGSGRLLALLANWRGAIPVVRLSVDGGPDEPVDAVSAADPAAVDQLRTLIEQAPSAAAVDTTGDGALIRVLLGAMPRWGRLMLASPILDSFTTDVYADIHSKGLKVCSGPDDAAAGLDDLPGWFEDFERARRLLASPARAAQLRACVYFSSDPSGPERAV
jgi:hypothetical protein